MAEDGDSVPEVWLSPNPKKTTWTSKRARYGRTPRSIPQAHVARLCPPRRAYEGNQAHQQKRIYLPDDEDRACQHGEQPHGQDATEGAPGRARPHVSNLVLQLIWIPGSTGCDGRD